MISFDIVTLFPNLVIPHTEELPFKKAVNIGVAKYNIHNLRDYSLDSYGTVDGKTYGGGVGMILMIEPIYGALCDIYSKKTVDKFIKKEKKLPKKQRIILLSPRGKKYNQKIARELSKCSQITLVCGRYEGIDYRVEENLATDVISIGNYILSGGELPALSIMESVTRLLPGVLEKENAAKLESFSDNNAINIEYPQYTRPENFMDLKVPEILLSGNHAKIEEWRKEKAKL